MSVSLEIDRRFSLLSELRWLVRLRWMAGAAVLAAALGSALFTRWSETHTWMAVLGLTILFVNLLFDRTGRILARREPHMGRLAVFGWTQLLIDLVVLTLMIVWTRGIQSPLLGVFVLYMVFASLLLPPFRVAPYVAAIISALLVAVGLWLTDQWPNDQTQLQVGLGWLIVLFLASYLANHITSELRDRMGDLHRQFGLNRSIVETAVDAIILIDEHGIIQAANPAAHEMLGYAHGALAGSNVSRLMPEPYAREHDDYLVRYIRTGEARIIGIGRAVEALRTDGTRVPVELAVSEVIDGGRRFFTGILRDVSERQRDHERLQELNQRLVRQQQALVQHEKMAAMGRMAAGVAHEIANPLACMDSVLQLERRRQSGIASETLRILREQVSRIHRTITDMTHYAHPNETAWERTSVNELIDTALEMVRFDHRIRDVKVEREFTPDAGEVVIMPHELRQVLVNLLVNALDAVTDIPSPRLTVRSLTLGTDTVRIEIEDNGCGIPLEDQSLIFDPFFTTKPVGHGTGLGLAISFSIVERHGGRLAVRSAPGAGATFSIDLRRNGPASSGREEQPAAIPTGENRGADADSIGPEAG